jgi:hypothetical protein
MKANKIKLLCYGLSMLLISLSFVGCSGNGEFIELSKVAKVMCDKRNGELIFFGKVMNEQTFEWNYESVCYKEDERHFYYEFVK